MAVSPRRLLGVDLSDPIEPIEPRPVPPATPSGIWLHDTGPTAEHSDARLGLAAALRQHFHRPEGSPAVPGGWWILGQVELELEDEEIIRPDLAGWLRERVVERPQGSPIRARPDWVCHVMAQSSACQDAAQRLELFQRSGVPFCWVVDVEHATLTSHRLVGRSYAPAVQATRWQLLRAEPFDAIEIRMGALFGD
ncbi:MAG TPA: Uma2 family endonuclease [Polyangiaceae bacterium]|nr:Uma2 family endonuclease [Polyangiaceae bacterium]